MYLNDTSDVASAALPSRSSSGTALNNTPQTSNKYTPWNHLY
jgi:hypothetical protein